MIKQIKSILEQANVPKSWYSIGEPAEARISIIEETDGIHVFIEERGARECEKVYTDWRKAMKDIAESFELYYTEKINKILQI